MNSSRDIPAINEFRTVPVNEESHPRALVTADLTSEAKPSDDDIAELGATMPHLLLSVLERRYLNTFDASRWRVDSPVSGSASRPLLRAVRKLGRPEANDEPGRAMSHVLTSSHWHGHTTMMAAYGDGERHRLYVGGRRLVGSSHGSTEAFMTGQASALGARIPGLELGAVHRLDGSGIPALSHFLHTAPAVAAVTGIPATAASADTTARGLDLLATAMSGRRYCLVVVAEPLDTAALDEAIDACRRLRGEVHSLTRRTVGHSTGESSSVTTTQADKDKSPADLLLPGAMLGLAAFTAFAAPLAGAAIHAVGPASQSLVFLSHGQRDPQRSQQKQSGTTAGTSETRDLLDANAEACEQLLQRHLERLQTARASGFWRTAVYVAADNDGALAAATSALRGICAGDPASLDPMRVIRADPAAIRAAMIRGQTVGLRPADGDQPHPLGTAFDSLATCLTSDEVSTLITLPRREIPGVPVRDVGEFAVALPPSAGNTIEIGRIQDRRGQHSQPVPLSAEALNRHVFISGMTGYGKSTTAKNLLINAYRAFNVPFLVIEPVKSEYRSLARHPDLRDRLRVYSIGNDGALPLRLNPFVPIASIPLSRHIDLLKAVFNAAFPMFAGMSYVLEEAMLDIYTERGWNLYSSANDFLGPTPSTDDLSALTPAMSDLYHKIDEVMERKQYGREIHQNLNAALKSRIQSLMVGTKGMALDTHRSIPAHDLFSQPTVIELRNLGDDEEKSFVMALLLCQLYEYAESRQTSAAPDQERLQHLTLIEEAHRLLSAPSGPTSAESSDSKAKAVTMFTDMLAEMRSYGEGFVIADQIPTKLTPEIMKNSSVKIVHRLVSTADRTSVAGTMNLTEDQSRHLATLRPGEAVVHDERIGAAVLVEMPQPEKDGESQHGDPPALVPDRSYLHRNGACRKCPDPCSFWHITMGPGQEAPDLPLRPLFDAILRSGPEPAWRAWLDWRKSYQAQQGKPTGVLYCAASQAAHRWLTDLAATRDAALRIDQPRPTSRLAIDQAARRLARLCRVWTDAHQLDDPVRRAFQDAKSAIHTTITNAPPRELPGCDTCPARCEMLSLTHEHQKQIGDDVVARATNASSPPARVRSLRRLVAEHVPHSSTPGTINDDEFLYCLITTSAAANGADVTETLSTLLEQTDRSHGTPIDAE